MTTIVWFRHDLRTDDQPALRAAAARGPVVPLFVWSPEDEGEWPHGAASRWWLHHSLVVLDERLRALGVRLVIRRGRAVDVLAEMVANSSADGIVTSRRYEPHAIGVEQALARRFGARFEAFDGSVLFPPESIRTGSDRPYQVYTPFARNCRMHEAPRRPQPAPDRLAAPRSWPAGDSIDSLDLLPSPDWAAGMRAIWTPGEAGALAALRSFVRGPLGSYATDRDLPSVAGTSRLSPHLHWGEVSPRRVWHAVNDARRRAADRPDAAGAAKHLDELLWREFAHHVLFHFPHTPLRPLRPEFGAFPWRRDRSGLEAWQRGATGYPLVDAGMRELWTTGWMHNRVRMVAASFLVKHLLHSWLDGARWFWDTLVDADLASNTLGWQWAGGCGADAAPYFRVFNPVLQGQKFDADGTYVRRWVPELAGLPTRHLHAPWKAPTALLGDAGVRLGKTYPRPIVAHDEARVRALDALATITARGDR